MNKYTIQQIEDAVKKSQSFCETCKVLGCRHWGGAYYNIRRRIINAKIDISHFDSKAYLKKPNFKAVNKKHYSEVLVKSDKAGRENGARLRKALIEAGVKYICVRCKNEGIWLGQELVLEVDHINEDHTDNRIENLRFMCPNCHGQRHKLKTVVSIDGSAVV